MALFVPLLWCYLHLIQGEDDAHVDVDDGDALDDEDDLDDGDELDDGDDKLFDKIMSDMFCVPIFVICLGQVKYVCVYSSVFFFFFG